MDWGEKCFNSLPGHWQKWLEAWCLEKSEGKTKRLTAYDFESGSSVVLRFEDGSFAQFDGAFYAHDCEKGELAVFTEHCGYHIFPDSNLDFSYRKCARNPTTKSSADFDE